MMTLILARNSFIGTIAPVCESLVMNNSLGYLDLSSNFLSGQLSYCWRYGKNLEALILANNSLSGEIPHSIGYLANLIYLQLQGNIFSKNLPSSLENIAGLEILDVSKNKPSFTETFPGNDLAGKIPSGHQFETFYIDSYVGNPGLCGFLLSRVCSVHLDDDITHCDKQEVQAVKHGENNWLEEFSFYISMGIGVNTSFWVFWATLMLKRSWRYAYMRYLDNMGNKIYVFAAIRLKINKQQRGTRVSNHQKNKVCPDRASGKQ
nr:receptor-like protein EIX1 [Nicotiana tomentosiformis]